MEKKLPVFKYYPDKSKKVEEKGTVGPGYLKELEESYKKTSLSTSMPKYLFGKAKIVRKNEELANMSKFIPGVGHYKDKEKAFTSYILEKKGRIPYISKYKDRRFTESYQLSKNWVPGPGSYDLSLSPIKKK
jgi:hypothetical protein